jgi:hypothetical protein
VVVAVVALGAMPTEGSSAALQLVALPVLLIRA